MPTRALVLITEDWFALSHFKPLLSEIRRLVDDVTVATNSSGRLGEIEELGVRAVGFDMRRGSFNPIDLARTVQKLARLIDAERPQVIHAISLQPIVLAALGSRVSRHDPQTVLLHITGLGYIAASRSLKARLVRAATFEAVRRAVSPERTWLMAENPDDIAFARSFGIGTDARTSIVPGAGVDAQEFMELPPPANAVPRGAYVGRLIRSKGVDVLAAAHRELRTRGVMFDLDIYGSPDLDNPDTVSEADLAAWEKQPRLSLKGHVRDVRRVWDSADFSVVPTLGGEGMPRALLEAAACGRPLIASDVPGCRHFVRDGIEGFLVRPGDVRQLADAIERLVLDPELRRQQGASARRRLVEGYTEAEVRKSLGETYGALLGRRAD
jgi:glycosyltransferase involved in cell wall biosynthesis